MLLSNKSKCETCQVFDPEVIHHSVIKQTLCQEVEPETSFLSVLSVVAASVCLPLVFCCRLFPVGAKTLIENGISPEFLIQRGRNNKPRPTFSLLCVYSEADCRARVGRSQRNVPSSVIQNHSRGLVL